MRLNPILAFVCLLVSLPAIVSAADSQRTLLQSRGSDSMAIAVVAWSEAYSRINRSKGVAVSGGGTGTGIAAMLNGNVDIANASREMTRREIQLARRRGIAPVQHIVGYDAVTSTSTRTTRSARSVFPSWPTFMHRTEKWNAGPTLELRCPAAAIRKSCG